MARGWKGNDPATQIPEWGHDHLRDGVFRFAVGPGPDGPRSSVYRLWTVFRKSEIFLAVRMLGGRHKVSLHPSGDWRIAHPYESGLRRPDGTRIIQRWQRPEEYPAGWTRAFEIWIPRSELLRPPPYPEKTDGVAWFDTPPPLGHPVSVFAVWLAGPEVPLDTESWPRIDGYLNEAITRFPLANGETVWLIRMAISISSDQFAELQRIKARVAKNLTSQIKDPQRGDLLLARTLMPADAGPEGPRGGSMKLIELATLGAYQ